MRIHRTHDGRSFDIDQPLSRFANRQDLFDAIAAVCDTTSEDLICMTQGGQQVYDDVLDQMQEDEERGLSSSRSNVAVQFFVYNRQYLYADLDPLVHEMEESAQLAMPVEEPHLVQPPTPRSLSALLEWCTALLNNITQHNERSIQCLSELRTIDEGTKVALSNLLTHADSVKVGVLDLRGSAGRELERMQSLLLGYELEWKILSMVQVNSKLLPTSDGTKAKPKERHLADYVSSTKMGAVVEACSSVHSDLQSSVTMLASNAAQLTDDTEGLRVEVQSTVIDPSSETLQEALQAAIRAQKLQHFLVENIAPDENGWPAAERVAKDESLLHAVEDAAGELILLDEVCRESLRRLSADKNDMMARSLHLLSDISSLQSEYADLSIELAQLDAEFKSDRTDGFRHLARLKNMLWAYGSTLIEIYRRKEFERSFLVHSQALAELMANFSEGERRRRTEFRAQVIGALPWDIKGIKENTPSLEMSTGASGADDGVLSVDRDDIDALFQTLDTVDAKLKADGLTSSVLEVKASLQQLNAQIEEAGADFVRLVEVGLLERAEEGSGGTDDDDASPTPRMSVAARKLAREKSRLQGEVQALKLEHGERERALAEKHDQDMVAIRAELSKVKADLRSAEHALEQERNGHDTSKRSLDAVRAVAESEAARRINMLDELTRLRNDYEAARRAEKEARAEASEETERANELSAQLHDVQLELDEFRSAHNDASKRVEALLSKGTSFEHELHVAQGRIDDLTQNLSEARTEVRQARDALGEAEAARDKVMRSYRAEADGDRAILEELLRSKSVAHDESLTELKRKEVELTEHEDSVKNLTSQLSAADAAHEELVRQLESAKEACMDAEMAKRQSERNLDAVVEKTRVLIAKAFLLSDALKRMPALSGQASKNGSKTVQESATADVHDEQEELARQGALDAFREAGDAVTIESVLDVLGWLTRVSAEEAAVAKLETLTTLCKKWMKAYKYANEKGQRQQLMLREKITFRNFAVGDLALFLPTRSNTAAKEGEAAGNGATMTFAKPWAAFNINFPHFFLNFSGRPENEQLRDSLRQKEWIVARITKIESRLAAPAEKDGNPFQLLEGVKFYLLDVQNWNLANSNVAPSVSRRKSTPTVVQASIGREGRSQSQQATPPLRRWDSTPDGITARAPGKAADKEEEADRSATGDIFTVEESTTNTDKAEPTPASSPSAAPSGLALALQQRISPPISALRNGRSLQAGHGTDAPPSLAMASSAFGRWGMAGARMPASGAAASVSSASSVASDRRLADSTAPAFGRSRRIINHGTGAGGARQGDNSLASSPTSQASGQPQSQSMSDDARTGARPINAAQRAMRVSDDTPNPFSASPAAGPDEVQSGSPPSLPMSAENGAADVSTGPSSSPAAAGEMDKGKGLALDGRAEDVTGRSSSRHSQTSVSSRLSALNIRSRPAAIAAPRIRSTPVLQPTMETAQGLNTFGHSASVSDSLAGLSMSAVTAMTSSVSHQRSDESGFSIRSASHYSTGAGSSGLSPHRTMSISSPIAAAASEEPASPASVRRSSGFFGGQWTLGRRSGKQARAASYRSHGSEGGGGGGSLDESDVDLSATVTDAKQSLRRLASYK